MSRWTKTEWVVFLAFCLFCYSLLGVAVYITLTMLGGGNCS